MRRADFRQDVPGKHGSMVSFGAVYYARGGKGERDQSKPDGLMTRNVHFTRIYRTCTCFLGLSHHNSLNCQFICVGIQLIHVVQALTMNKYGDTTDT